MLLCKKDFSLFSNRLSLFDIQEKCLKFKYIELEKKGMNEKEILVQYLPPEAVDPVYHWIIRYKIHLRITRNRSSKLGDYRPPGQQPYHRISINYDLNPYAFLITFVHELAHLVTFKKHGSNCQPHGTAWKANYRQLLHIILEKNIFPPDLEIEVNDHLQHIRASSHADLDLTRVLHTYDKQKENRVEDLKTGDVFLFQSQRKFLLLSKARTRYKCRELATNKIYLFHALTPVLPLVDE